MRRRQQRDDAGEVEREDVGNVDKHIVKARKREGVVKVVGDVDKRSEGWRGIIKAEREMEVMNAEQGW